MNKKWKMALVTLAVAIIATLSIGITVAAEEPDSGVVDGWYCGAGSDAGYRGYGATGTADVIGLLGLTADEYQALRNEGKSLAEIAAAQGVTNDALIAVMLAPRAEMLADRVAEGYLTQEQADEMLAQMAAAINDSIQRTDIGPRADRGSFGGRGGFFGGHGFGGRGYAGNGACGGYGATTDTGFAPGGMMRTW